MLVCCSQHSVAWKKSSRTEKLNRVKHRQIWQGNCVENDVINATRKYLVLGCVLMKIQNLQLIKNFQALKTKCF